ncbi:ABC transporter permease [Frankia canadensis]|uniref:ABC transporter permease n=1 Tax=Frankia canadensis TaxID=1836972 RepID=UPI001A9C3A24|nr:ABC transporter permease [Frankia canadensis]
MLRTAGPIALLGLWQLICSVGLVDAGLLPSPWRVADTIRELTTDGTLLPAIGVSLRRAGVGLLFGAAIGITLGLVAGLSRIGEEALDSSLQMLRTIPFIALVPLFVVWFGIGEEAKYALITAACIFPAYLNTYAGVRGVDPKLIEAARVFKVSGLALAREVILPLAMPGILVGIRFSMGVSVLALVAAEQINTQSGIGVLVLDLNGTLRTDIIISGVVVYAFLGIVVDLVVRNLERLLLRWKASIV